MNDKNTFRTIDETIRQQFESGWAAGNPQPIEALVGQPNSDNYLATLEELVHIELEFRWKERDPLKRPQLEDYLERFEPLADSAILSRLVNQEIKLRLALGETPTSAEYEQRFPEATVEIPATDQGAQDTGVKSEDDVDTQHEMPTMAPESGTDSTPGSDPLDSATLAGPEQQAKRKIILEGDFVPGYDLLGELGRGGMGVVYQARDQKLKRIVALKMILSGVHASEEDMQRFQTEAEAVAKLQHPNIVQIFEVGEHKGNPYFSLEYQEGGGLDNKIAGTPQNIEESAQLIETLARAMQTAHEQGIIHRDLKPPNILLSADGEPKITDFGLAKRMDDDSNQTKSGAVMGTPSYMAPEQASSSNETIGPAADTYALGAILYHLLTGRPPFRAETQLDTLMQVISDEPLPPRRLNSKVPADLETICLKCLQKDIKRRYSSCEELAEDLRRFQAGEPIAARPVSAIERGWKWTKRRPAIAGMIGVSIVAAVALVAGGLVYNGKLVDERNVANAQRQQAETAQQESEKQTRLAQEQKEAADRNFKLARDAVDELTKVSEDELFNLPRMEPVRRQLLEKAKSFYQEFTEQSDGDPQLMLESAKSQMRLAKIISDLGDPETALENYEKAGELASILMRELPGQLDPVLLLISTQNDRANELYLLGRLEAAVEMYEKAISLHETLANDHPRKPVYLSGLATSYSNLSNPLRQLGRVEEAIEFANKGLSIRKQIAKENPSNPAYEARLASGHANLGLLLYGLGKFNDAVEVQAKANASYNKLVEKHPEVTFYAIGLARSLSNSGLSHRSLGQFDQAEVAFNEAIVIVDRLSKDHPDVNEYTSALGTALNNLGITLMGLNRLNEAVNAFRRSIKISDTLIANHPGIIKNASGLSISYFNLGKVLVDLGKADEALDPLNNGIDLTKKLVQLHPDNITYRFYLASTYNNLGLAYISLTEPTKAVAALDLAVGISEKLLNDQHDVVAHINMLAMAYNNMALSLMNLGQQPAAVDILKKAIERSGDLVEKNPNVPEYGEVLSLSYVNLSKALLELGKLTEGVDLINEAILSTEKLRKAFPKTSLLELNLGMLYNNLGAVSRALGNSQEARTAFNQAIGILEPLHKEHPQTTTYADRLVLSYNNLGGVLTDERKLGEAIAAYEKSISLTRQLVKDHPGKITYTDSLAITSNNIGRLLEASGKLESAADAYVVATVQLSRLAQANPMIPRYRKDAATTLINQARVFSRLRTFEKAKKACESAILFQKELVAEYPDKPEYFYHLSSGYVMQGFFSIASGDYSAAVDSSENLRQLTPVTAQPAAQAANLYNAACLLSLASAAAAKDEDLAEAKRATLVDKYAARAVALLKEDRSLGYFKDPANVAHMKQDTDLDPLRDREDFQTFVTDVEAALETK